MNAWNDRFKQFTGKKRFVVSRIFLHLKGDEVPPMLGVLNRMTQAAIDNGGDLYVMGESLVKVCESLLQRESNWMSASNEGEVLWSEEEASDYLNELFTDSSRRYFSEIDETGQPDDALTIPMTSNLVVMITICVEGEVPTLETDLSNVTALRQALTQLCNLQQQERFRAVQLNYSPDQIGYTLDDDQVLQQFPELIPL